MEGKIALLPGENSSADERVRNGHRGQQPYLRRGGGGQRRDGSGRGDDPA